MGDSVPLQGHFNHWSHGPAWGSWNGSGEQISENDEWLDGDVLVWNQQGSGSMFAKGCLIEAAGTHPPIIISIGISCAHNASAPRVHPSVARVPSRKDFNIFFCWYFKTSYLALLRSARRVSSSDRLFWRDTGISPSFKFCKKNVFKPGVFNLWKIGMIWSVE